MMIKSNRFAILPIHCYECQKYIWLEPYRHGEIWDNWAGIFIKVNICRHCYKNFKFGKEMKE